MTRCKLCTLPPCTFCSVRAKCVRMKFVEKFISEKSGTEIAAAICISNILSCLAPSTNQPANCNISKGRIESVYAGAKREKNTTYGDHIEMNENNGVPPKKVYKRGPSHLQNDGQLEFERGE
ncbi:unnamed protein product [Onchocerca flexuosa]|uniref:Uncharacterized protein n=1 Tax=Onchocerca flexuosa TaxID=387005 RepID=A0A183GZM3_9BILA|nr:unnamed protein product [Onchocerca flexuosa]